MLEVVFICAGIFVGLLCGWWLRGNDPRFLRIRTQADEAARTREVLTRLRDVTHNVASDVDKHKALMGRLSDELNASDDQQSSSVLRTVDKLIQFNERMQQQLSSAEEKLEDQARQIANQSVEVHTDALTGLANRRAFDKALKRAYRASLDRGDPTIVFPISQKFDRDLNDLSFDTILPISTKVDHCLLWLNGSYLSAPDFFCEVFNDRTGWEHSNAHHRTLHI